MTERKRSAEDKPCKIHTKVHRALQDYNVNFCADLRKFEAAPIAYTL
jgi:hypothetical protein